MPKKGLPYQQLVAKVEAALDRGAEVTVEDRIEGPDGRRDCDVSVRGTHEGNPYFVFIECKDWKKRVGIEVVDGLDSKRKDLGVDLAVIYSNSGFTDRAIRKAGRVGISLVTAVASNDPLARTQALIPAYGRLLGVTNLAEQTIEPEGQELPIPPGLTIHNMLYEGKPVHNWLVPRVYEELNENEERFVEDGRYLLRLEYTFGSLVTLDMAGVPYPAHGVVAASAEVEVSWMSKVLPVSVDLARVDLKSHRLTGPPENRMTVPPETDIMIGPLDEGEWAPSGPPLSRDGSDGLNFTVRAKLRSGFDVVPGGTADLDSIVVYKSMTLEKYTDD